MKKERKPTKQEIKRVEYKCPVCKRPLHLAPTGYFCCYNPGCPDRHWFDLRGEEVK
jgi:hypothetical protein